MSITLDHVGIVVEDLARADEVFRVLTGRAPRREVLPEAGIEALFFSLENANVEVLCFGGELEGVDPRVCRPPPGGGIQHLACRVSDLDSALGRLRAAGAKLLEGFPRRGFHGRIAFLEHPAVPGFLELVEGTE